MEAAELAKKLEEEEERRAHQKKKKDVFASENWDSLLADQFDGGLGESYGVLLVSLLPSEQGKERHSALLRLF